MSEVLLPMSALPSDKSPVMLSALQHYLFCPRQCALIHVDGVWSENFLTAAGRQLHERVDRGGGETRRDVHLATALRLTSQRLGLTGVADMVEFRRQESALDESGLIVAAQLPGRGGYWRPFPVEYKRGAPKSHHADEVQLCAQALCLEEMLGVAIVAGALFYGETRRRTDVSFDSELRNLTENVAERVHALMRSCLTPQPSFGKRCNACSIVEECRPKLFCRSARDWLKMEVENMQRAK